MKRRLLILLAAALPLWAQADALDQLSAFQREVKSGRVTFTQVVSSPNGKQKTSKGSFEFQRTASRLIEMQSAEYMAQGHGEV